MPEIRGFIDIGSNTVRLAVFATDGPAWRLVDEEKRTMRLGQAFDADGHLDRAAVTHLIEVLQEFVLIGQADGVIRFVTAATAAMRQAKNQADILARVHQETGLTVEVLPGEEEARLGALGALNTLDVQNGFIVDIGGASAEISLVRNRALVESVSLPMGAVNLTAQFLPGGEADARRVKVLESYIDDRLQTVPFLGAHKGLSLVGMGGTVRTLAKIHRNQSQYPLALIHNYSIPAPDLLALYKQLTGLSVAERRKVPGMGKERADIIIAGGAILTRILEMTRAEHLITSGSGVREGLLLRDIMGGEVLPDVLMASVRSHMVQFGVAPHAAVHIAGLALTLYDGLASLHGMGVRERRLLQAAALLHSLGSAINYYNWQDHTFHVLVNTRLFGVTHAEQVQIAAIAGYKNGKVKERLAPYASLLPQGADRLVRRLGVILALARSLDRCATQVVQDLQVAIGEGLVIVRMHSHADARAELTAAQGLADDFDKAFGRPVRFSVGA